MNKEQLKEAIDAKVSKYIWANYDSSINSISAAEHVIAIGKSILYDKHQIMSGGGFVSAFNRNDLRMAHATADVDISKNIGLLLNMSWNIQLYD